MKPCTASRSLIRVSLLALAGTSPAAAHDQSYGFVRADQPTTPSYFAEAATRYNDGGGGVRIERSGLGAYAVHFGDIAKISATSGNVQVSAYGPENAYCKTEGWTASTVYVNCFDAAGSLADSAFTALYLLPDAHPNSYAYALAFDPQAASYEPPANYTYHPDPEGLSPVAAARIGVGHYSMTWSNLSLFGVARVALVTSVGAGNERCTLGNIFFEEVEVYCFDPSTGDPVDAVYSVLVWVPQAGDPGVAFAAVAFPLTSPYTPTAQFSYNAGGGPITHTRTGTGVYNLDWEGMEAVGVNAGTVQVSAVWNADGYCRIAAWGPRDVDVHCYDGDGSPADRIYTALFLKPPKKPWARSFAFARADEPSRPFAYHPEPAESFNWAAGGESIFVERLTTGRYRVDFLGFGALPGPPNVQVSQLGAGGGGNCAIGDDTFDTGGETSQVFCDDASGSLSDERFDLFLLKASPGTTSTFYAFAHDELASAYAASNAYNPSGGSTTATRSGTGVYAMTWAGARSFGDNKGHVQVSAEPGPSRCKVASWGVETVNVRCYDPSGAPADSAYSVLYLRPDAEDAALAFAWTNSLSSPSYTPPSDWSFNSGDGPITATRSATGTYAVHFDGFAEQGVGEGHVQVTAYGAVNTVCVPVHWNEDTVFIECRTPGGALVDSFYTVLFVKPLAMPEPAGAAMWFAGATLLAGLRRARRASGLPAR